MTAVPQIRRVLHALGICLLVIATAGVVPAAGSCLEDLLGCGAVCMRCRCKHRNDSDAVRAVCPCCQQHPGTPDRVTGVVSAVLFRVTSVVFVPPARDMVPSPACHCPSFSPSVPHPPPRTL